MPGRSYTAFIDLLFVLLLALLVLTMPKQPVKTSAIAPKAEFLVEVSWDAMSCSDIDTWLLPPGGRPVWYSSRQIGLYSLDRDDLGCRNDTSLLRDGSEKIARVNREVVTFRGWEAGRYTVNLFSFTFEDDRPVTATVRLVRLNPFRTEFERHLVFEARGQELTAASFDIGAGGRVFGVSTAHVNVTGRT